MHTYRIDYVYDRVLQGVTYLQAVDATAVDVAARRLMREWHCCLAWVTEIE